MKSIKDYLVKPIINDSLDLHFYAEFVLHESFKTSYFTINEKYGSYIGQKQLIIDLSEAIWTTIYNNEPEDRFELDRADLDQYDNVFFDKLIIQLNNNESSFVPTKSKYNDKTNLFDIVFINMCYGDVKCYGDVCSILMHEILHAYNEYMSFVKKSRYKLWDLTNKNSAYAKTIQLNDKTTIENICKRILNNIRQFEQNAYISELAIELEKNKFDLSKFKTTNDAFKAAKELFMKSDVWMQYVSLYNVLHTINKNKSFQDEFAKSYNDINNTTLSFNKIYKKLNSVFDKILIKMERQVPKLFYDYYQEHLNNSLSESSVMGRQNKSMIEFLQFCNNYMVLESVKADNGKHWQVFVNNKLDEEFTKWASNWKKYPKIGKGWYCGGTVFKIVDIKDNLVYVNPE